jgi:hypothetical protein
MAKILKISSGQVISISDHQQSWWYEERPTTLGWWSLIYKVSGLKRT